MKKILLFSVIFLTVTIFCFAEEQWNETEPPFKGYILGGTMGLNFPTKMYHEDYPSDVLDNGMGFNVFVRYIDDVFLDYMDYLYINFGYVGVPVKEHTNLITFCLGTGIYHGRYANNAPNFKSNKKHFLPYFELEVGGELEFNYDKNKIVKGHLTFAPALGLSQFITNRISLDANIKGKFSTSGIFTFGINFGLGYLFH